MAVLARRTNHAETDGPEQDEDANDDRVEDGVNGPLDVSMERPGEVVQDEAKGDDGEV